MNRAEFSGESPSSFTIANVAALGRNSLANTARLTLPWPDAQLVVATPRKTPHQRYAPAEVEERLTLPAGYASGYITDSSAYHSKLIQPRTSTGLARTSRMQYRGPVYLQGKEPTCMAWSVIHAAHAVQVKPTVPLATDLLNQALPKHQRDPGGMDNDTARSHIKRHSDVGIDCRLPSRPHGGIYYAAAVARLVRRAVDDSNSAVIATVRNSYRSTDPTSPYTRNHAICITGYSIDQHGFMDVQCIDSNIGEARLPVEIVAEELNNTTASPLAVITSK